MLLRIQQVSSQKFFVLKEGGTLNVELHTTFFNPQSDFYGSFSYPGQMPLNEINQSLIQNAQYIATNVKLRTFYVLLWIGELPWKTCKFNFTLTDQTIQYTVYFDSTLISSQLSALLLCNMSGSLPGVPSLTSTQVHPDDMATYMKSTVTAAPGTMPMVFAPWKNDGAYTNPGFAGTPQFIGEYNAATNTPELRNADASILPGAATPGWFYKCTVAGSPDWGGGAGEVFEGDLVMLDSQGTWYATYNPYGCGDSGYPHLVFPPQAIINRWELDGLGNGSFILDEVGVYDHECQTQTPFFYLWFVMKRIFAWFGINTVIGSAMSDPDFLKIVIFSRVALDDTGIISDVTYYMPNISAANFFKAVRELGYFVDFDLTRNIAIVETLKNLEQSGQIMDLRPYQVKSYRETSLTPTYYELTQPVDGDDSSFGSDYVAPVLQVGDMDPTVNLTQVTTTGVATNMIIGPVPTDPLLENLDQDALLGWPTPIVANWRVPYIKQPIYRGAPFTPIVNVKQSDANNFKLRFLYYHGMVSDSVGYPYPYLSSDNQDVNANSLGTFNMSFDPETTDFQPLVYYYTFLLNGKPFEQGFLLSKYLMRAMKANMRYLVWDDKQRATIPCLLDQALFDLKDFGDKVASKLTLYPIVQPDNAAQITAPVVTPPPTPPYDNGTVYIRFALINAHEVVEEHPTEANSFYSDLYVTFWADSAGTVPKNVIDLPVSIRTVQTTYITEPEADTITDNTSYTYTANGTTATLLANAPTAENFTDGSGESIVWVYTLLGSPYYIIIT